MYKRQAYSYDQQPATLRVSVTYRVPPEHVAELYSEYGTINNLQMRVLERKTPDAVKNVFGQYTAVRAIQERQKLGLDLSLIHIYPAAPGGVAVVGAVQPGRQARRRTAVGRDGVAQHHRDVRTRGVCQQARRDQRGGRQRHGGAQAGGGGEEAAAPAGG